MLPDVCQFLNGKKVFVTGVTGFVGLALVEKLIRTAPGIGYIFLLIRPKRGKSIEDRLNEIKKSSIFETIINQGNGSALDKLKAVEGNIDAHNLGISEEDQETLITEVDLVFHCAATLDFEASLKTTVEVNLLGTERIVQLCKRMRNLKALVHVSSAYVNADKDAAEEKLYSPPESKLEVLEMVQSLTDSQLAEVTPVLLKNHPNTYTFTKALAEHEVASAFQVIPTCIVRPSMIVGVWKDPVPGWTNSKNGPQGFIMGAAMGVIRRLPVAKHLIYDYIPVDVVVNTMIVGAVYTSSKRAKLQECPIFQCTSSTCMPFRWANIEGQISGLLHKYPAMQAVWYPHLKLLPSVSYFRLSATIFHMTPAYIFDTISRLMGARPRLVRLHTSVNQSLERLEPFIFREWKFDNSHCMALHNELSKHDREIFGLDVTSLNWSKFFDDMAHGVRRYLLNEKDSSLPKARKKLFLFMVFNILLQVSICALLVSLVSSFWGLRGWQSVLAILPFLFFVYKFL